MRLYILLVTAILLSASSDSAAQLLIPNQRETLVRIKFSNEKGEPLKRNVFFIAPDGKKYTAQPNRLGFDELLLPLGKSYRIIVDPSLDYGNLKVPDIPYNAIDVEIEFDPTAEVILYISDRDGNPISEEITLISKKTGKTYKETPSSQGLLMLKLPIDDEYQLNFASAPNYYLLQIPEVLFNRLEYQIYYNGSGIEKIYPSRDKALFELYYFDLNDNPLEDEPVHLRNVKSGYIYEQKTDKDGKVSFLVPLGTSYEASVKHFEAWSKRYVKAQPGLYIFRDTLNYLSSEDFERRKEEQRKIMERNDEVFGIDNQPSELVEQIKLKVKEQVSSIKAQEALNQQPIIPPSFEVYPLLNKMDSLWPQKTIVMDITKSMYPYCIELLTWLEINQPERHCCRFVFFNDGDENQQKKIGSTGGLYIPKNSSNKAIVSSIIDGITAGSGGDADENDLEAVLEAIETTEGKEIVLIADNMSKVRDMQLLGQINIPVRIVLCGVKDWLNEDYLEIAYKTNGSVHLTDKDFWNISRMQNGDILKYRDKSYLCTRGKFVVMD